MSQLWEPRPDETPGWISEEDLFRYKRQARMKEISTRRLRPCLPELNLVRVLECVQHWDPAWEVGGGVRVFDDGLMQYTLVDSDSHHRFYAALALGKTSLRCTLVGEEPADLLGEVTRGSFVVEPEKGRSPDLAALLATLTAALAPRGFRFPPIH